MNRVRLGMLLASWLLAGCDNPAPQSPSGKPAASPSANWEPTQAQPKLKTVTLYLGANELPTEIAVTEREVRTGMMFRTNMPEMEGMIFVFDDPDYRSFWMRNTLVPLSCAYIDSGGIIREIHDMKPKDETSIPSTSGQIQYVLEVNQGWFTRHNVAVGTLIRTEKGSLQETFFRRRF